MATIVGTAGGVQEMVFGMLCGILYGTTSPLIGHPFDTIKTKMQTEAAYAKSNAFSTFRSIIKTDGFSALYRGLIPPLIGSSIFRSVQFSAYAFAYASVSKTPLQNEIPGSGGLQYRVLTAGLFSSFCRTLIETPIEFAKVRMQVGQEWKPPSNSNPIAYIRHFYNGFNLTFLRTWGLMGSFFVFVDVIERNHKEWLSIPIIGPFMKGSICGTLAWVTIWPFEVLKNQMQADTSSKANSISIIERLRGVLKTQGGFFGLYRGIGPGLARSLTANGTSMVVYNHCQSCVRSYLE